MCLKHSSVTIMICFVCLTFTNPTDSEVEKQKVVGHYWIGNDLNLVLSHDSLWYNATFYPLPPPYKQFLTFGVMQYHICYSST